MFMKLVKHYRFSAIDYNNTTGVGIVTTINNHGLKVDHQVRFVGFTNDAVKFNGSFVITENKSLTSFSVNIGN